MCCLRLIGMGGGDNKQKFDKKPTNLCQLNSMKKYILALAIAAGLLPIAGNAKAQYVYSASEELSLFGYLNQRDPRITTALGDNGCVPTSWVNSLNYFQNVNSSYFGSSLVGTSYQDWINTDLTLAGPKYLNTTSASGTFPLAIVPGLESYFSDLSFPGLNITFQKLPSWNQLYQNLVSLSATQLLLVPFESGIGHAVSLVAINWDSNNSANNSFSYVDPENPTKGSLPGSTLTTVPFYNNGQDTVVAFYYPGTTDGYFIQGSVVVTIPEPSTYALFGLGAIGLLMVIRRKMTV